MMGSNRAATALCIAKATVLILVALQALHLFIALAPGGPTAKAGRQEEGGQFAIRAFYSAGAGIAAALSVRSGCALRDIDIGALQAELQRQGVRID